MVELNVVDVGVEKQQRSPGRGSGLSGGLDFGKILGEARETSSQPPSERGDGARPEAEPPEREVDAPAAGAEQTDAHEGEVRAEDKQAVDDAAESAPEDAESAVAVEPPPAVVPVAEVSGPLQSEEEATPTEQQSAPGRLVSARVTAAAEARDSATAGPRTGTESSGGSAAQLEAAPAPQTQGAPNALDLLSFSEVMDPELVVEPAPEQLLARIQQAMTTGSPALLEEAEELLMPQVVRAMATLARNGTAEMRLQLDPPDLGEIELRVRTSEGVVRGQLLVQHAEVKQLLDAQLQRLRAALEQQGLELEGLDVGLARNGSFGHPSGSEAQEDANLARAWAAAGTDESTPPEEGTPVARVGRASGTGAVDYLV